MALAGLLRLLGVELRQLAGTRAEHERNLADGLLGERLAVLRLAHHRLNLNVGVNLESLGAAVQAAEVRDNGLTHFVLGRVLVNRRAVASADEDVDFTAVCELEDMGVGSGKERGDALEEKVIVGAQMMADKWEPRVPKQTADELPRDLHFLVRQIR